MNYINKIIPFIIILQFSNISSATQSKKQIISKNIENNKNNTNKTNESKKTNKEKAGRIVVESTISNTVEKTATKSASKGAVKVKSSGGAGGAAGIAAFTAPFVMSGIKEQENRSKKIQQDFKNKKIGKGIYNSTKIGGHVIYSGGKNMIKGGISAYKEDNSTEGSMLKEAVGDAAINLIPVVGTAASIVLDKETKKKVGAQIIEDALEKPKAIINAIKSSKGQSSSKKTKIAAQAVADIVTSPLKSAVGTGHLLLDEGEKYARKLEDFSKKKFGKNATNRILVGAVAGPASLLLSKEEAQKVAENIYEAAGNAKKFGKSGLKTAQSGTNALNKLIRFKNPKEEFKEMGKSIADTGKNIGKLGASSVKIAFNTAKGIGSTVINTFKNPKEGAMQIGNGVVNVSKKTFNAIKGIFKKKNKDSKESENKDTNKSNDEAKKQTDKNKVIEDQNNQNNQIKAENKTLIKQN
jgi:hypothetical protein